MVAYCAVVFCVTSGSLFLLPDVLSAQPELNASNDWKVTQVGKVRQLVVNRWRFHANNTGYPGLIDTEYPAGSGIEFTGPGEFWLGGINPDGEKLVSVGSATTADELWPTNAKWDTIWVVNGEETAEIPYWEPVYYGRSDQDYVSRFNDYNILNPSVGGGGGGEQHNPLYFDVIEIVYTWSNPPLNEVVLWSWRIMPDRHDIKNAYFSFRLRSAIGPPNKTPEADDRALYLDETHTLVFEDGPGGPDEGEYGAIGFQLIPPADVYPGDLNWTFLPRSHTQQSDAERYNTISSGKIMEDQQSYVGHITGNHTYTAVGPFDIPKGDTLVMRMAEILGPSLEELKENVADFEEMEDQIISENFTAPKPPPVPPLRVETRSKAVRLDWSPTDEVNPETYEDPNRGDSLTVTQPFEGYRVYKSTQSSEGPWTLLAEYDIAGNWYGENTGLQHNYTDNGLLNNVEYYYSVTAFSKKDTALNWPSLESSLNRNVKTVIPGPDTPESVGEVAVVPNPYRGDIAYQEYQPPWEHSPPGRPWMEQDRKLQFINLPENCTIKIYTAAGDYINTIEHRSAQKGYENWNMTSYSNQAIASGLYLFVVEDLDTGETQTGKFVILK